MKLAVSFRFAPNEKIPVGMLSDFGRDTVFEYDTAFLSKGINPAPFRLPPRSGVQVYDHAGNMADAVCRRCWRESNAGRS